MVVDGEFGVGGGTADADGDGDFEGGESDVDIHGEGGVEADGAGEVEVGDVGAEGEVLIRDFAVLEVEGRIFDISAGDDLIELGAFHDGAEGAEEL